MLASLAATVLLGVVGASHAAPRPEAADSSAAAAGDAENHPPARSWQLGSLRFQSCELRTPRSAATTAAWCKNFEVPEDRTSPDGRRITLRLAVLRSDAPEASMVVMLAGGPGQAATESFQNTDWYAGLLKHHHVVLLDQRGTGTSHPLSCPESEAKAGDDDTATLDLDKLRANTAECLAEVERSADPRFYTTTIAVEDLEAVRQALGAPQFDLFGVSYGTRMAQQYVMRHPEGVRSLILDSPVPNQAILGEDFARNLESALEQQFAACTTTPACSERFGDPMATLRELRDALAANPHRVRFRDPQSWISIERTLSAPVLVSVVRMFAYTPETAALLPLSIDASARGDVGPLLGQAKLLSGDLGDDMNSGMALSVICSEDADQLAPRPEDAATLLGNQLIDSIRTQCATWPRGSRPADFHAPLKTDKPILILSGELDPVTPPAYGQVILAGLKNARQLIGKGQGHGLFARGCTPRLIEEFVSKLDPLGLDASCLDELGPTPAFISFNGAAP